MQDDTQASGDAGAEQVPATDETKTTAPAPSGGDAPTDDDRKAEATADSGETQDTAEADDEHDDDSEDEAPKKRRRSGSERLKRRVAELEAQIASAVAPRGDGDDAIDAAIRAELGNPPQESDYADWLAYQQALSAYETAKLVLRPQMRARATEAVSRRDALLRESIDDFEDRVADVRKSLPDYDAVINSPSVRPVPPHVLDLIIGSEKGPLLAYHLAKNAQVASRLSSMSPVQAAMEIGRLEARVSLPKATATKAPPPTSPPKGGASAAFDQASASMDDYIAWRRKGGGA